MRVLQTVLVGVIIAVSVAVGGVLAVVLGAGESSTSGGAGTPAIATERASDLPSNGVNIAAIENLPELIERVRPSVVRISTTQGAAFGGEGVGAGIVLDDNGNILTNFHVVEGATGVLVELNDGTQFRAEVIGTDPSIDLAVVRADLPDDRVTPARFGDSDAVKVGESVFAIGNPFGLSFTVTSGIISGRERERPGVDGRPIRNVLQTDAAVNPGNSGGPLFNARGEVIGINMSIENPTGQRVFVGIGFAVPSNTATRFLPQLLRGETPRHPQLGISGVTLDTATAEQFGVDATQGVYVTGVGAGSPAERAGLRAADRTGRGGDIITAIDGRRVRGINELAEIIDSHAVGDEVALTVQRGGQELEVRATLREWQAT